MVGIRGGVWIRRPDGNAHPIQNLIEQELSARGMALFNLRREPAESLIKNGEWDPAIAASPPDVVIVGRFISQMVDASRTTYPTVQHVHTTSGLRFDSLPAGHPDRPLGNSTSRREFAPAPSYQPDGNVYFFEHFEHFRQRREAEKVVEALVTEKCTLDARFYGPDGSIRGGYARFKFMADEKDPFGAFTNELVTAVVEATKKSLLSHEDSLARLEMYGG